MASITDIVFGVVCTGIAIWSANDSLALRRDGTVVDGTVVGVAHEVEVRTDGIVSSHMPIVEFWPAGGGAVVRFRSDVSSLLGGHDKGDKVTVRYLPDRPEDARIDSVLRDAAMPLIFGVLALAAFAGKLHADRSWTLFSKRWED